MAQKTATYPAKVKALVDETGATTGEFEILASVFGVVDKVGDRVMPGAFDKSLAEWKASGDPIPIIFSHQWDNPEAYIGAADPADVKELGADDPRVAELAAGDPDVTGALLLKGRALDTPSAAMIHSLVKQRLIREASFSYDIPPGGEQKAEDGANELRELGLIEGGPTLKGAMQLARSNAKAVLAEQVAEIEAVLAGDPAMTIAEAREKLGLPPIEPADDDGEKSRKVGARNAAKDAARIQAIHDHSLDLGATCISSADGEDGKSGKAEDRASGKAEDRTPAVDVVLADIELRMLDLPALAHER